MKISIRQDTFETNSSSVHAVIVLSQHHYERWKETKELLDVSECYASYGEMSQIIAQDPPLVSIYDAKKTGRIPVWCESKEEVVQYGLYGNLVPYDVFSSSAENMESAEKTEADDGETIIVKLNYMG